LDPTASAATASDAIPVSDATTLDAMVRCGALQRVSATTIPRVSLSPRLCIHITRQTKKKCYTLNNAYNLTFFPCLYPSLTNKSFAMRTSGLVMRIHFCIRIAFALFGRPIASHGSLFRIIIANSPFRIFPFAFLFELHFLTFFRTLGWLNCSQFIFAKFKR
jgi:hypothetical protein